jgi:hypothetical protein
LFIIVIYQYGDRSLKEVPMVTGKKSKKNLTGAISHANMNFVHNCNVYQYGDGSLKEAPMVTGKKSKKKFDRRHKPC